MKKHLVLLLSLCAVIPSAYAMEGEQIEAAAAPQEAAPAIPKEQEQTQPSRIARACGVVTAFSGATWEAAKSAAGKTGHIAYVVGHSPVDAASWLWQRKGALKPSSLWSSTKIAALTTKDKARQAVTAMLDIVWGTRPELPVFPYVERRQDQLVNPRNVAYLAQAMEQLGRTVTNARKFQIKRTLTLSTLAAALSSGIARSKQVPAAKSAAIGCCTGAAIGIISWFYHGKRAKLSEIARRFTNKTADAHHFSPEEATMAYKLALAGKDAADEYHRAIVEGAAEDAADPQQMYDDAVTGNRWYTGMRNYGPYGLRAMRSMRDEVAENFPVYTNTVAAPAAAEEPVAQ